MTSEVTEQTEVMGPAPFAAAAGGGAVLLCAEHVRQLEGASPFHNLMEVK